MAGRLGGSFFILIAGLACAVAAPGATVASQAPSPIAAAASQPPAARPGDSAAALRAVPPDTARNSVPDTSKRAAADSVKRDTVRTPPVYRWVTPYRGEQACYEAAETATGCWRDHHGLAAQEIGVPGARAWTLSLTEWERLGLETPFSPEGFRSQYYSGGMAPPERFALRELGGGVTGIEELWAPVAPLDTPVTQLDWERGALALNVFHLKLKRMLSERAYLGLEFYSASGDSAHFDYQFNVHQPYLSGWGFLGKIYPPIDRDSTSIVLEGESYAVSALEFRPRVGFWLDTDKVVELFMTRSKNVTSLARPQDFSDSLEGGISMPIQVPIRSGFAGYTGGAVYGETGAGWSSQWEASASSLQKAAIRGDSLPNEELTGSVARVRGAFGAPAWPLAPTARVEAVSELWEGKPLGPIGERGWTDRESAELGMDPVWGPLELRGDAGLTRSSRMQGGENWLPLLGAYGRLRLPLGFGADAGLSYRERDPDWELTDRSNPALFLYPNPALRPRSDRGVRGSVSWGIPQVTLEAGFNLLSSTDAWLPFVLPEPEACGKLADSVYQYPGGPKCLDAAPGAQPLLADSLALRLRNYEREERDSWHLGLGLALGNWSLNLENHFLLTAQVEDPALFFLVDDRSAPERVFKGRLRWRRDLVDGRMHLDLRWNWEWYSTRYGWAPDLKGESQVVKLDEYLALDFEADMRIKTFTLYFKAVNLNHDRYYPEPGVHPTGLNFRFGVDWTLFN